MKHETQQENGLSELQMNERVGRISDHSIVNLININLALENKLNVLPFGNLTVRY